MNSITNTPTQPQGLHQIWCKNGMFQPPILGPKLSDKEIKDLADFIHRNGLWLSIIVDEDKAVLAGGKSLLQQFEDVGVEWIPVIQIDGLSIAEKASFDDAYNLNNGGQS